MRESRQISAVAQALCRIKRNGQPHGAARLSPRRRTVAAQTGLRLRLFVLLFRGCTVREASRGCAARLAGAVAKVVELGATGRSPLRLDVRMLAEWSGEYVWNVPPRRLRPLEILRTTNDELRPRLRLAMTTPS